MGKLSNYRIYIIITVLLACVALVLLTRSCVSDREVQAEVSSLNMEAGRPLFYADSTKYAQCWRWEFGNGDSSLVQEGVYIYKEPGRYQIRLTVDNKLEKKFLVTIQPAKKMDDFDEFIYIVAPASGMQGEYITFRGEGSAKEWRWEFGETGVIDAREKNAIYRYENPGNYEVSLTTEETQYPIRHFIKIEPHYSDNDTMSIESMIGNDIKEKLQAIVNQESFERNYNDIRKYLCRKDHSCLVVINNSKKNDLYSYCQGLRLRRHRTKINEVLIEGDSCVTKLDVLQTDLD